MSRVKVFIAAINLLVIVVVFSSCQSSSSVPAGRFYLGGNVNNAYIDILKGNQLKLVDFDTDILVSGIEDATGFDSNDLEAFREIYDLSEIFSNELEFEFVENRLDFPVTSWIGYSLILEKTDTISFMGNKYIKQ